MQRVIANTRYMLVFEAFTFNFANVEICKCDKGEIQTTLDARIACCLNCAEDLGDVGTLLL